MSLLQLAGTGAGGIGLFLLGMTMMADGLKVAAGPALERILAAATHTRLQALASGAVVTALVQSSSAVTVAAIGFVNAGLLGLAAAVWVLFGANVGTTMTGWIVALVGLKLDIAALALPLVALGVLLLLTGAGTRRAATGQALAGFGLLFLGIALLQQAFSGLAGRVELPQGSGAAVLLAQLGIGVLLTVLMQSSSASMTVALTAAQGGLLSPLGAAAVVIGANIGTTATAVLAALSATANARRVAVAHVVFNVTTGAIALVTLPLVVHGIDALRLLLDLPPDAAVQLALFHTVFNAAGVLLMWPFASRLTRWLQTLFVGGEREPAVPRHLDDTVLAVPALALDALAQEIARSGAMARQALRHVLDGASPTAASIDSQRELDRHIGRFVDRLSRSSMSERSAERLAALLRRRRDHALLLEAAVEAGRIEPVPSGAVAPADALGRFLAQAAALLDRADALQPPESRAAPTAGPGDEAAARAGLQAAYGPLKAALLQAGVEGRMPVAEMDLQLRRVAHLHRALELTLRG